jgi:hypothetical protein
MARKRVLPRHFPELSEKDWCEIYYCLERDRSGAFKRVNTDGRNMDEKRQARLSEKDWIEIYLAVEDRRDALKCGLYGKDRLTREWQQHMNEILRVLAPVRKYFISGKAA